MDSKLSREREREREREKKESCGAGKETEARRRRKKEELERGYPLVNLHCFCVLGVLVLYDEKNEFLCKMDTLDCWMPKISIGIDLG